MERTTSNADRGPIRTEADARGGRMPTRRELLSLGIGAFVVASLPLARGSAPRLVRRTAPVMGTIAELLVVHRDERYAHAALGAALADLQDVEARMTRFRSSSEVGRVNQHAGREGVAVSEATAEVIAQALRWAEASGGAFDPSIGRAVALWDVGEGGAPPSPEQVEPLAGRSLYRSVEVDRWRGASAVRLLVPDAALDLGGIAKGYGVDRAARVLRGWGIERGLVNVGGDLYALGTSPEGDPWRVGVRDPDREDLLRGTLHVEDAGVATSGDYERYFMHRGVRYHHLLDPETAAPRRTGLRSVTVVAPDCLTADAATTTVFGMGAERGAHALRRLAPQASIAWLI